MRGQNPQYGAEMRLLPIPDAAGNPTMWINADHLVSVQPVYRNSGNGVVADAELKIDGLPLQRVPLGEYLERVDAEAAFAVFLERLQAGE